MNKLTLISIGVVVILLVSGVLLLQKRSEGQLPADQNMTSRTEKAPDFSLKDYNGKTVKLADFSGRPLVLNSWAAWCPFCREELPDFAAVQKELGDKVVIIAIDRAESLEVAKGYSDEQGTTNDMIFLLDPSDSFYQSIGGFSMPETIFVDKEGFIRDHKRGPMKVEEIRARITKIL